MYNFFLKNKYFLKKYLKIEIFKDWKIEKI